MSRSSGNSLLSRIKGLFVVDVDWDELEKLDKPCPRCKQDTLYREDGRFVAVDRCRNCRFEGATKA